ncbi:trafficking protein particle complex subunit 8 isoform X2 [Anthonomus grandis grandis]|nr:trafficking protein particle complex subunit 8 isoform X2 [Anthonomus grandis grandis]
MRLLNVKLDEMLTNSVTENTPKWFSPNVLKYYVLLHDNVDGDITSASESYNSLKSIYGALNCYCLKINSRPPGLNTGEHLPDPWSQFLVNKIDSRENLSNVSREMSMEIGEEMSESKHFIYHPLSPEIEDMPVTEPEPPLKTTRKWSHGSCLSVEDIEHVKTMIYEFTVSCLVPYIEQQIAFLNDSVANKKGVSKSLFSATKRWFSTNKPVSSPSTVNHLVYLPDSSEVQIRKLGDLYFMFENYSLAFQMYHTAKRDYNTDQAWLFYAGALEMAALSAFLANESSRKTLNYMEESITTYLTTCKMPFYATRATILSIECLKAKDLYGEAALQLIRMTSEDSDLRSALFLEQASCCFLRNSMLRKYAFHMVLAGHRYFKASQKKHSLRCYRQAYQIYENVGWGLASDHIHYSIGRLATSLKMFDKAEASFAKLLTGQSKQSAMQQALFLKEYLAIVDIKSKEDNYGFPILPVPELNNEVKVLVGPTKPLMTPGKVPAMGINFSTSKDAANNRWHKLEEMMVTEEAGTQPIVFKPMVNLYFSNNIRNGKVLAIINEPIQVSVQLVNSLQTALILNDIYLLWSFENEGETITNVETNEMADSFIKTYITKSLVIQGNSKQDVILSVTPLVTGELKISAICYTLTGTSTNVTESISVKGKQLFDMNGDNTGLPISVEVAAHAPCLQMNFSELSTDFLSGELQRITVDFQNTGSVPLKNIIMATSLPHLLSNCEINHQQTEYTINDGETPQIKEKLTRKNHLTTVPLPGGQLGSNQSISFYIWLKAPQDKGSCLIDLLTYYENIDNRSVPRYRLIRHCWMLSVQESIFAEVATQCSFNSVTAKDLSLALKITNSNNIHNTISTKITLLNLALLSNNWILTKDFRSPPYINLNSQESAHIFCKARRQVSKEVQYSSLPISLEKMTLQKLPDAYQTFAKKSHTPLLNAFSTNVECKKRTGTLILEWRALVCDSSARRIVYGQNCIPIRVVNKEQELDKMIQNAIIDLNSPIDKCKRIENQNYVTYNLFFPLLVRHNFTKQRCCIIPVKLTLHNNIEDAVQFTVDIGDPKVERFQSTPKQPYHKPYCGLQNASNFSWLVNGKKKEVLQPLSTTSVKLSVIVTTPGTFELGSKLRIFCNIVDKDETLALQSCEVYSSLIVIDA